MKTFRPLEDVDSAGLAPAMNAIVLGCMQSLIYAYGPDFDADDTGGVVLLDRDTDDDDAYELFGRTWCEGIYEGVTYDEKSRCYITCVLYNNKEGVTIVIPDEPDLDEVFREVLVIANMV